MGSQRVGHDLVTKHSNNYLFCSLPVAPTGIKFHEAKHFCRFNTQVQVLEFVELMDGFVELMEDQSINQSIYG